jgi:hypothetical protein
MFRHGNVTVETALNGTPTHTTNQEQHARCCDCGLVHLLKIRAVGNEFEIVAYRDDYLTDYMKARRRKDKRKAKRRSK